MKVLLISLIICLAICQIQANNDKAAHKKTKHQSEHTKARKVKPAQGTRIETINNLADVIIREAPTVIDKLNLNPFYAGNQSESAGLGLASMRLDLNDMNIYNLSNIERRSDVIILDDATNRKMTVGLKLKFNDVQLKSKYRLKASLLNASSGNLTVTVPEIDVDLQITIDFLNVNATLDYLNMTANKELMKVKFGNSIEAALLNLAMPAVMTIMQRVIVQVIESPLKREVNSVLQNIIGQIKAALDASQTA